MPTHGSLSKAGKMRFVLRMQPVFREVRRGQVIKKFKGKKSKIPRIRNKLNYKKRIIQGRIYEDTL